MRRLTLAALATLLSIAPAVAQPAAKCAEHELTGLDTKQAELVTTASLDPIVGCDAISAAHHAGDFTVAPRDTVRGNIVIVDGNLLVSGTVIGKAIALNGAVVVDASGHVTGDVIAAARGATIAPTGRIDGELRTIDDLQPAAGTVATASASPFTSLKHTAAWFGVLLLLGIGVLTNAGESMQRVSAALNEGFGRNVMVGVLAQLALLPVLLAICLLLCLTILGILLVPFAIVAYFIAVLGLVVLGGLGAAQMVGRGTVARRPGITDRGAHLQALMTGMALLAIPWVIAAACASWPGVSAWLRTLAFGLTWVGVTAGLGAALRTRGGTRSHLEPWGVRRPAPSGTPLPVNTPQSEWLTPTPLTGVVAVKRPTAGTGSGR